MVNAMRRNSRKEYKRDRPDKAQKKQYRGWQGKD